tara:strand:+ start:15451 stop:16002 length:552 start_codon:yes stop_codon:yes gene_type:complete
MARPYNRKPKMTEAPATETIIAPAEPSALVDPAPKPEAKSSGMSARRLAEMRERRERDNGTLDTMTVMRLGLPDEVISANADCDLRWVNDEGGRIEHLTRRNYYDVVDGVEGRTVGTNGRGEPIVARLLRKPKEFAVEDQKAKLDRLNQIERSALKGEGSGASASSSAGIYAPSDNNIRGFKP